jgi:ribonucleoside-diphosphate reductase alpha chain
MFVIKRDGKKEPIMFDKITARIKKLCYGFNDLVDPVRVAMRVIEGLYDGVTTSELEFLFQTCTKILLSLFQIQ